jgi:hypothetical protein
MPSDAVVRYTAYVPGTGWLPKKSEGYAIGPTDQTKRITAIKVTVETQSGAQYGRGYGICYSTKQANAAWSSEVCNGSQSGTLSGGQMERFRVRLITPANVAANVCYAAWDGGTGNYMPPKCDGGAEPYFISGYKVWNFYLYTAGAANRGYHTRSIWDLTSSQRSALATRIQQCVTPQILETHRQIDSNFGHEQGLALLEMHRNLIYDLEKCLVISGAGQFVPIPYWNPGDPIPVEARAVKQTGGPTNPPLERSEVWKSDVDAAKAGRFTPWELFWHPTVEDFADWEFVLYHNAVHGAVGGTMDGNHMHVSPAAVVFWLFHAYLNNIYTQWQDQH